MKKDTLYTIAGGAWIGGTMTVPGVSGGSMAMILGLYDRLIASVNGIFKDKQRRRESLLFLIKFLLGAVVGLFLFAKLITFLLENELCAVPTRYFFLGAVAGGAPLIFRSAGVKRVSVSVFLYPIIGIAAALLIAMIPNGIFEIGGEGFLSVLLGILIQLAGGHHRRHGRPVFRLCQGRGVPAGSRLCRPLLHQQPQLSDVQSERF